MNHDYVYTFDKITHAKVLLGEIQTDFNMGLTIDGTKDSVQLIVRSFVGTPVEANTIMLHEKTQTWWVCSKDKVERYQNDSGFVYIHNLEMLGAIELLNARDLTDNGNNANTYTTGQLLERLFSLSNFEFDINIESDSSFSLDKKVDFIKTFENYTLLSAIREFLDGYNCCAKLEFSFGENGGHKEEIVTETITKTVLPSDWHAFGGGREIEVSVDHSLPIEFVDENIRGGQYNSYGRNLAGKTLEYYRISDTVSGYTNTINFDNNYDAGEPLGVVGRFYGKIYYNKNDESTETATISYATSDSPDPFWTYYDNFYVQELVGKNVTSVKMTGFSEYSRIDFNPITGQFYIFLRTTTEPTQNVNLIIKYSYLYRDSATLKIYSKTGNINLTSHDMSFFDDVRETRILDKQSFGTNVISNAENVVSTQAKTYPTSGAVTVTGTSYQTDEDSAVVRLPSNVFKVNWLKITHAMVDVVIYKNGVGTPAFVFKFEQTAYNKGEQQKFKTSLRSYLSGVGASLSSFEEQFNYLMAIVKGKHTITFYGDTVYEPLNNKMYSLSNKKIPKLRNEANTESKEMALFDKETRELLKDTRQGMYWERGTPYIRGFTFSRIYNGNRIYFTSGSFDEEENTDTIISWTVGNDEYSLRTSYVQSGQFQLYDYMVSPYSRVGLRFIVNYIPMSDIKIDVANRKKGHDIQVYNQNGKLTDSHALSKLLNSYSKEISSDNVTKFKQFTSFNDIPKVGSLVIDGNEKYVINNISLDFSQNESNDIDGFGYFIDCEFTMSKYVATKSLMVNPNTNIRDYGIPQQYNVKRKQKYGDLFELAYSYSDTEDEYYIDSSLIFNFSHNVNQNYTSFVSIMKINGYFAKISGNSTTNEQRNEYYQLEPVCIGLNKMFCIVLDFKDNNIIGYDCQTTYGGFDIENVLSPSLTNINTPISYVSREGTFDSIKILFVNSDQLGNANINVNETNRVFVSEDYYNAFENSSRHVFAIEENEYKKDALEIPVFEYICQVKDTNDVIVGDNIFEQDFDEDIVYFYSYVEGENLNPNNVFPSSVIEPQGGGVYSIPNSVEFENGRDQVTDPFTQEIYFRTTLIFKLYSYTDLDIDTTTGYTWTNGYRNNIERNKDYAIFRHTYNTKTHSQSAELLFIAKKVQPSNNQVELKINHYKIN